MLISIPGVADDDAEFQFVLVYAILEKLQQCLSVAGAGNDPRVKPRSFILGVVLAEIEHELEGVVTDFEVVCVARLQVVRPL